MRNKDLSRRGFMKAAGAAALALPFYQLVDRDLRSARAAASGPARRVIFYYFPDGVAGWSYDGNDHWHATGSEQTFQLTDQLSPLASFNGYDYRPSCVFLNG